jgi:hypothetical protein
MFIALFVLPLHLVAITEDSQCTVQGICLNAMLVLLHRKPEVPTTVLGVFSLILK